MYVIIPTTLVCVLFGIAIPTSPFNFLQFFLHLLQFFFVAFAIVFILITVLIFSFAFSIIVYDVIMLIGIKDGHTTRVKFSNSQ